MRDDGVLDRVVASEVMRSGWTQDTYEEELMVLDELDLEYKESPNINSFMSKWVNELLVVLFMRGQLGSKCSVSVPVKFEYVLFIFYHGKIFIVYTF